MICYIHGILYTPFIKYIQIASHTFISQINIEVILTHEQCRITNRREKEVAKVLVQLA